MFIFKEGCCLDIRRYLWKVVFRRCSGYLGDKISGVFMIFTLFKHIFRVKITSISQIFQSVFYKNLSNFFLLSRVILFVHLLIRWCRTCNFWSRCFYYLIRFRKMYESFWRGWWRSIEPTVIKHNNAAFTIAYI